MRRYFMGFQKLQTEYSKNMDKQSPWQEYPRPQFKRESYINLNGLWDYLITESTALPDEFQGKILVPFPLESSLSGVEKNLKENEFLFYRTKFSLPKGFFEEIVFLNFGAVDQETVVYLNRHEVGRNNGGYLPFALDITKYLKTENELIVRVKDALDLKYPYGKQTKKRGGIWYTPVSGIWQTVWLESVRKGYFKDIKITPNIDTKMVTIDVNSEIENFSVRIICNDQIILNKKADYKKIVFEIEDPILWTPENPHLYKIEITNRVDKVNSYFAMRKFGICEVDSKKRLTLNNQPYFFNGLLDQGYFPDGLYTPATIDGYIDDILRMKELGFNTLRKHIKVEPLIWYNLCDKLGMIVWQDMVNNSSYSFFEDTVIPTLGFKNKKDDKKKIPAENKKIFIDSMEKTVDLLYNTPSIALWTIFNEGWGQFMSVKMTERLKQIDSTRLVDATSGWFDQKVSDLLSLHIYFKRIKIKKDSRPIILSEFGGYSYKLKEHSFNIDKTFGYRYYTEAGKFNQAFIDLYEKQIIPGIKKGLSAAIYTQVSDVEDETNGILTYDRKVCKLDKEKIKELNSRVKL